MGFAAAFCDTGVFSPGRFLLAVASGILVILWLNFSNDAWVRRPPPAEGASFHGRPPLPSPHARRRRARPPPGLSPPPPRAPLLPQDAETKVDVGKAESIVRLIGTPQRVLAIAFSALAAGAAGLLQLCLTSGCAAPTHRETRPLPTRPAFFPPLRAHPRRLRPPARADANADADAAAAPAPCAPPQGPPGRVAAPGRGGLRGGVPGAPLPPQLQGPRRAPVLRVLRPAGDQRLLPGGGQRPGAAARGRRRSRALLLRRLSRALQSSGEDNSSRSPRGVLRAPSAPPAQGGAAALTPVVAASAVVVGLTTTAILLCSHIHQEATDRAAGKLSPVVRIGRAAAAPRPAPLFPRKKLHAIIYLPVL